MLLVPSQQLVFRGVLCDCTVGRSWAGATFPFVAALAKEKLHQFPSLLRSQMWAFRATRLRKQATPQRMSVKARTVYEACFLALAFSMSSYRKLFPSKRPLKNCSSLSLSFFPTCAVVGCEVTGSMKKASKLMGG